MLRKKSSSPAQTRAPAQDPEMPTVFNVQDEEMLTTKEVARRLKVTTQTVQRLINRGELIASRVGRDWRIRPSALEAFLQKTQSR